MFEERLTPSADRLDMIDRVNNLLLGRKKSFALLVLVLAILSVLGATQIRFDDGARDIFASTYPEYIQFTEHKAEFPQADTEIVIVARSERPFDQRQLEGLRDLVFDGQLVDGIEFAHSIFSVQKYDSASGEFQNLIADDLSSYPNMSVPLNRIAQSDWQILPLVNPEQNEMVIVYSVEEDRVDEKNVQPILDELGLLLAETAEDSGLELRMTGTLPILNLIVSRIISEQALLNAIGGILGALVSLLLFRSLAVGLLNGIAPIFAVLLTLGAMGWFGLEMNVITNSISILILVITMANCIHMTFELRKNAAAGKGRDESVRAMMRAIAAPCMLTGLTTMIAMAGLFYSGSALIEMFAVAAIVGLILSMFSAIVVHPLVFAVGWRLGWIEKALTKPLQPKDHDNLGFARTTQWLIGRKYPVVILSGLFAVLLLAAFLPVESTHRFNEYLYDDEPIILSLKRAESISSPSQSLDIVLRQSLENQPLMSNVNFETLGKVHQELEKAYPDNHIYSLHSLRRILLNSGEPADPDSIEILLDTLPDRMKAELIGLSESAFKLSFRVEDQPSPNIRQLTSAIEAQLKSTDTGHLTAEPITGLTALSAHLSDQMIKELTISFLIAAFACPLLIGLWFREWRYGLAAVLPNVIPVLVVGAWLMASGWKLQFTGAIALSIAFGVAVDDTIHVLNRLHINRRKKGGAFSMSDLSGVMQHVAPALITTTLVLSVGLSSAFFSEMPTVLYFGSICIAIFLLALLADLLMLLPMIAVLETSRRTL
ncbi:MAG: MMPL family transporter [Parasphingorhabdus sp.]